MISKPRHLALVYLDDDHLPELLAGRVRIEGIPLDARVERIGWSCERKAFELLFSHPSFPQAVPGKPFHVLALTAHTYMADGRILTDRPDGMCSMRLVTEPSPERQELLERAQKAIYALRNGGEDDPYVIERADHITGDDDEGDTNVYVSDDCYFCSVPAFEGQPMIDTAHQIAGAGKLIADLVAELHRADRLAAGVNS